MKRISDFADKVNDRIFNGIYSRSLVYNTCWEDPAVDRHALELGSEDTLLVITSAGCNVLDYALTGPRRIYAVDANPRQTALLELKLAGIRRLEYEDFFAIFGHGRHTHFKELYLDTLRETLSPFAQNYWDRNGAWFTGNAKGGSFYFQGLSGWVAHLFHGYLNMRPGLRDGVIRLLASSSIDEQREIYDARIHPLMWGKRMNWLLSRQFTMNLLGVPHHQRREVEHQHEDGVAGFIRQAIEYVFRNLPLSSNYFWNLYLRGHYTENCCPEYLKEANFQTLKQGLADCIAPHTCTITHFLNHLDEEEKISRFVLLDHMDWMSHPHQRAALTEEWTAIFAHATPGARVIFRSARKQPTYLDEVSIPGGGSAIPLLERLHFHPELADFLQRQDRVHTYAGFHIADVLV